MTASKTKVVDLKIREVRHFRESRLNWLHTYRIIPASFPPIHFFEDMGDPSLLEERFYIESLTNDQLRDQVGDLNLVSKSDRVCGKGSSVVMASFTHLSRDVPTRFSKGDFGVYYAAKELETAIRETVYHREQFLQATHETARELTVCVYRSNALLKPVIDCRKSEHALYHAIHHPENYTFSQEIGSEIRAAGAWGIAYNSVRHDKGECVAILRPAAVPLPVNQIKHLRYVWNGNKIHQVYEITGDVLVL